MQAFLQRHAAKIVGSISCLDRVLVRGTLPTLCYKEGMMSYLNFHLIPFIDYPRWAQPHHDQIVRVAERMARQAGQPHPHFIKKYTERRKEDIARDYLARGGDRPGLICVLSAMESCPTYRHKYWTDAQGKKHSSLRADNGKCLHYYYYFNDPELGLVHLRVPTWAPFGLQFYFNGHSVLERQLREQGIGHTVLDNSFATLEDFAAAQRLAEHLIVPERLHAILDSYAALCCPPAPALEPRGYHWSLWQVEFSTDVIFTSQEALAPLYEELTRTAVLALKADHVANFLGRKLDPKFQQELGSDFALQVEGRRIKHRMGPASLKMYDKFGLMLRVETTTSDVSFFKHHRRVEHKDGTMEMKIAPMLKTIYNLEDLCEAMGACNRRYLEWLAAIEDPSAPLKQLDKLGQRAQDGERTSRGFNLFLAEDLKLMEILMQGQWAIAGVRNRDLQGLLGKTSHQVSHLLKRLRTHGVLKKVGHRFKYYLTVMGKGVLAAALRLRRTVVLPALSLVTVGR